ncbi:MAG: NAD(P)-dependent oxidoreductase [Flavobacteriales bacterium]|nr:NAD(P)-dependent oxidoreductase [Flavobacteriales bacterium]
MKIAVIGAAGFVGQVLISDLNQMGIVPTTITRGNGLFMLNGKSINNILFHQVSNQTEKFDVVINLAFPTGDKSYQIKQLNDGLIEVIKKLSHESTKVIHTSTLAVFGFDLSHPIRAEVIESRRDYQYVESKIYFENALRKQFSRNEVHIVRLGNVWGPSSKNWTVPLLNNILYGLPTAVYQKDGFSNTTDVANVSSYLRFLASENNLGSHTHFHHLAEFSNVKWSHWLRKFSDLVDMPVEYLYNPPSISENKSVYQDVVTQIKSNSPKRMFKDLYKSRMAGSVMRSLVSRLPTNIILKMEKENVFSPRKDDVAGMEVFFEIMGSDIRFESSTVEGWKPEVNQEQSWNVVKDWVEDIKVLY